MVLFWALRRRSQITVISPSTSPYAPILHGLRSLPMSGSTSFSQQRQHSSYSGGLRALPSLLPTWARRRVGVVYPEVSYSMVPLQQLHGFVSCTLLSSPMPSCFDMIAEGRIFRAPPFYLLCLSAHVSLGKLSQC